MRIAVQGCSHGGLEQIYQTIVQFNARTSNPIDLLLLCGDFQALRSRHDFASLAVPPKFKTLGSFHQYYSGERVAPVLTIVIGGNHEASNYMWELYHGGWLAPSIYYLGTAGSVYVNGLRIAGASGIFKGHDFRKGHFEKVPYNGSDLRSVYHIREYDVEKLMRLTPAPNTIFLSHDWPISIAHHGDKLSLLRRKPFFRDEIAKNTLGSPPLLQLLKHLQPSYWFSAHLHVKFAALFEHDSPNHAPDGVPIQTSVNPDEIDIQDGIENGLTDDMNAVEEGRMTNPDEIKLDDEEFMAEAGQPQKDNSCTPAMDESAESTAAALKPVYHHPDIPSRPVFHPEEIAISDEEFEEHPKEPDFNPPLPNPVSLPSNSEEIMISDEENIVYPRAQPLHTHQSLPPNFLDSTTGGGTLELHQEQSVLGATKFLALDKCGKGKAHMQFLEIMDPSLISGSPRITYDPEWLAICRAFHPYLSTSHQPIPIPSHSTMEQMIQDEIQRIQDEGLLVPKECVENGEGDGTELVWEKGEIDIGRVQRFWWTAPPEGHPGGNERMSYTNPQTEAFCGMLGLVNKVNPAQ
ncbi:hypothetical protein L204_104902 [Cryptococcus depauperatus]